MDVLVAIIVTALVVVLFIVYTLKNLLYVAAEGEAERREVGNSIELITAEEIAASGLSSVDDILRGKVQGLTVTGGGGGPGIGGNINIIFKFFKNRT